MTKRRLQKKVGELNLRLAQLQRAAHRPIENYFTLIYLYGKFRLLFTNTITLPFALTPEEAEILVWLYEGRYQGK